MALDKSGKYTPTNRCFITTIFGKTYALYVSRHSDYRDCNSCTKKMAHYIERFSFTSIAFQEAVK